MMFQLAVINGLLLFLVPPLLRASSGATLADLGICFDDWGLQAKMGVIGALLLTPVVYVMQGLAVQIWGHNKHPVELMMLDRFTVGAAVLAVVSTTVLAPMVEELLFRGVIQRWLSRLFGDRSDLDGSLTVSLPRESGTDSAEWDSERYPELTSSDAADSGLPSTEPSGTGWGPTTAIVATSALFAVMHSPQWPAPIGIFFLSLGLGTLYRRTGSLIAAISMHAMFNGFSTILLLMEGLSRQIGP